MAKPGKKKVEDALAETVTNLTKDISGAVKDAVSAAAAGGDENTILLRKLQQQYSKATLKIYRKGKNSRDELFVTIEGQDLKEIEAGGGLDTLCLVEGGTGEYNVHVVPPGGGDTLRIGPLNVTGAVTRYMPRSKELYDGNQFSTMAGLQGLGGQVPGQPSQNIPGFGAPIGPAMGGSTPITKGNSENAFQIKELAAYMTTQGSEALRAQEQSSDRMVMMQQQQQQVQMQMQQQMQQQQRESSQQMMTLLATMFQNNNNNNTPAAESAELRVLKEQIEQMKSQREQDDRFRAQERQMEELKRTIELQRVENSQPKGNPMLELLVPLMTSQQTQAQSQQNQLLEVMKMANDRPGEDEKMSNIFSTLTMSNQATMNMVMEIARSGLMGGGDDHPIRDAVLQGLDTLRDLGVAALSRDGGGEEEAEPQEVVIQQPMPEAQAPQLDAPMEEAIGALGEGTPDYSGQEGLVDEEIERFMRDSAFQRLIASLMNNDHVSEATARLYGHAHSGNPVAARWLNAPETVTAQIFELYEMKELTTTYKGEEILISEALIEDMYDFSEYVKAKGDVNKWAKTGYKPLRRKARDTAEETTEEVTEEPTEELIEEPTEAVEEVAPITEDEDEKSESVSEEGDAS